MKDEKRDVFFDIAKGVGIISVVLGHCFSSPNKYIYCYHMFLFFFITGFFYNKKKYEKDPVGNIVNKLKNNYPKYFIYSFFLLLGHNIFLNLGIIDTVHYSISNFIVNTVNLSMFVPSEILTGALWFIPVMIYAISIFGVLVYIGSKFKSSLKSLLFVACSSFFLGIFGLIINAKALSLFLHVEISILIIPIIFLAYLCKQLYLINIDFKKYLTWYGFIISLLLIIFIFKCYPTKMIELTTHTIFTKELFYPIVILGLYMSLSFSKMISDIKVLSNHVAWIGTYSFQIMTFQPLMLKMVDYVYVKLGNTTTFDLTNFPISEPKLFLIYLLVGIYGPIFLISISRKCFKFMMKALNIHQNDKVIE